MIYHLTWHHYYLLILPPMHMSNRDTFTHSINAFMRFAQLTDPELPSNWENLYDSSIWFKILGIQFVSPVSNDQLSLATTRHARDRRWENLTSLYRQLMYHFETHIADSTVNFKVPLLGLIAERNMEATGQQAIVYMNALVLGAFVHLQGVTTFRKLSEEDENRLSDDMMAVGSHQRASLNITTHTLETLQQKLIKAQNKLEDVQAELAAVTADQEQSGLEIDAEHRSNEEGRKALLAREEEIMRLENEYETLQDSHALLDEKFIATNRMLDTSRLHGRDLILQVERLESNLAEKSKGLENEMVKVVDYEKIISQMKQDYSQLEKENQDATLELQNALIRLDSNANNVPNNIHKICQDKIKELRDKMTEKDGECDLLKGSIEVKETQLELDLQTINNYMEDLEAKQTEIQSLQQQLQMQEHFVPHQSHTLAEELNYTNSQDHSTNWVSSSTSGSQSTKAAEQNSFNDYGVKAVSLQLRSYPYCCCSTENWWKRRYTQLESSAQSLKTDIQTFQTQAMELKSQLQNLRLEYNVLYTEGQMTKETLQPRSQEEKGRNQIAELRSMNKQLWDLHTENETLDLECQQTKETLQSLEEDRIRREAKKIRMDQTCLELKSESSVLSKKLEALRDRLSDTQQKLKRTEIQSNERNRSNLSKSKLEALTEEMKLVKGELEEAQNLASQKAERDLVTMSAAHALGMREQRDRQKKTSIRLSVSHTKPTLQDGGEDLEIGGGQTQVKALVLELDAQERQRARYKRHFSPKIVVKNMSSSPGDWYFSGSSQRRRRGWDFMQHLEQKLAVHYTMGSRKVVYMLIFIHLFFFFLFPTTLVTGSLQPPLLEICLRW
ncbi:hypothetical protein C8J57DRAFT_1240938 [Mycena rebaudengoi]|nr:hypothetical protein C8J57DRAFT_1240938 [Mycena rebaudengoi]